MRHTILLFILLQIVQKVSAIPIDNSISDKPNIQCDSDSISLIFSTRKPFIGRTFVKGYIQDSNCFQVGNQYEYHKFTIRFNQCGLRRSREYNGIRITATVIISFHPIFLTKVDRAYRLNCFYMESSKTITQQLEIGMMTTEELHRQTQMPICRYEILSANALGVKVRYAKVGDSVYHRWTCLAETKDLYCMKVHTCTVSDGQGGEIVEVLDNKGCSVDKYLLVDLEYTDDLSAGQESHVFKFADRPALYFNCQLELTIKDRHSGCANARPICKGQIRVEPSEQPYEKFITTREDEIQTSIYDDNNKYQNYPSPLDADYEIPHYGNELINRSPSSPPGLPGPPGPPGPPAPPVHLSQSSHFQHSSKVYSMDDGDEDISTVLRAADDYGQLPLDRHIAAVQGTTINYEDRIVYKRLIRKRRNSTNQYFPPTPTTILRPQKLHPIANVDLPEQCITVFDIEDESNGEIQSGNTNRSFDSIKNFRTCFSTALLAMILVIIVATFIIFILALIFVFRNRRIFSNDDDLIK